MLTKWDEPTVAEILQNRNRFHSGRSPNRAKQLQAFRDAEDRLFGDADELKQMVQAIGHEPRWNISARQSFSAELGTLEHEDTHQEFQVFHEQLVEELESNFCDALEEAAEANLVGRIKWLGPKACRFDFFEKEQSKSLTKVRTRTIKHSHELINAKKERLPARHVPQPRRCKELIQAMPSWMNAYIVTGTLIRADHQQVAETEEASQLVRATRAAGRGIGIAAAAPGKAIGAALVKIRENLIDADPALIVGDFVLTGWR